MKAKTLRNLFIVIGLSVLVFLVISYFTGDGKYYKVQGMWLSAEMLGETRVESIDGNFDSKYVYDFFIGGIAGALTLLVSAFILLRPSMDK